MGDVRRCSQPKGCRRTDTVVDALAATEARADPAPCRDVAIPRSPGCQSGPCGPLRLHDGLVDRECRASVGQRAQTPELAAALLHGVHGWTGVVDPNWKPAVLVRSALAMTGEPDAQAQPAVSLVLANAHRRAASVTMILAVEPQPDGIALRDGELIGGSHSRILGANRSPANSRAGREGDSEPHADRCGGRDPVWT